MPKGIVQKRRIDPFSQSLRDTQEIGNCAQDCSWPNAVDGDFGGGDKLPPKSLRAAVAISISLVIFSQVDLNEIVIKRCWVAPGVADAVGPLLQQLRRQ
jgi:hypothetical protein